MKYKAKNNTMIFFIHAILIGLMVFFGQGCSSDSSDKKDSPLKLADCPQADAELRSPTTFQGVTDLINALPKPLTLNCFLYNYDHPMEIFAVDNELSAQPSEGPQSPRIFIIKNSFTVSVVPAGPSKDHVEFSKIVSSGQSVKGDLAFPIQDTLSDDDIFESIVNQANDGTVCRLCHGQEEHYYGNSYLSNIIAPEESVRVTKQDLVSELENCRTSNTDRCAMLNYIYATKEVSDIAWPF